MASRSVTAARKQSLLDDLRESCRTGELVPGDQLPSMRELAAKYELSHRTVILTLQQLVEDGTLRSVPRVGMVVARPVEARLDVVYLAVVPERSLVAPATASLMLATFEGRVAQLGGRTVKLGLVDALEAGHQSGGHRVGGIFVPWWPTPQTLGELGDLGVPAVVVASVTVPPAAPRPTIDVMAYDNVEGGRVAASVLLEHGSERVGYVGVHRADEGDQAPFAWSKERAAGWRHAHAGSHHSPADEILPARSARSWKERVRSTAHRALRAVEALRVDGLVCANDELATAVIARLQECGVPATDWPTMIGFDSTGSEGPYLLTSMRRPAEQLARAAADVLWKRSTQSIAGQTHLIPMELTQRLSAAPGWAVAAPGVVSLQTQSH